jgi:microcystin degradation protein MlrC
VRAMQEAEKRLGIASVSLVHGFPWGDVADMGAKCLVLADNAALADATAIEFGKKLKAIRADTFTPPLPLDAALDTALAHADGPVVLADIADNPGGGAPGDSTLLLQRLLSRGVDACVGPFWDPAVATLAQIVGVGGCFKVRLGGKAGPDSGPPLDVEAEVLGVAEEAAQTWSGTRTSLGRACALGIGTVRVMVASLRDQAYGPDLFRTVGIEPTDHRLVVVKSAQHFVAGFAPMARAIVLASGGGPLEADFRKIPYRNIPRPMWPLDAES